MPTLTRIVVQKRKETRRNIYIDGKFVFGCHVNVVARFHLHVDMQLSVEQIREIEHGQVKQECFDKAMQFLSHRLHSRSELSQKLRRQEWGDGVVAAVIEDLTRMGYLDDARFAGAKAQSAAQHKHHGRRRAFVELMRSGVSADLADKALAEVYSQTDTKEIARNLAMKQAPRLKRLAPEVARRRLVGMLQRRGFDYESIRPVVDEVLGADVD